MKELKTLEIKSISGGFPTPTQMRLYISFGLALIGYGITVSKLYEINESLIECNTENLKNKIRIAQYQKLYGEIPTGTFLFQDDISK